MLFGAEGTESANRTIVSETKTIKQKGDSNIDKRIHLKCNNPNMPRALFAYFKFVPIE